MSHINIGDIVKTKYNSGIYVGKVIEDRKNFWLVEVKAVLRHPTQGDLHKPNQVEGVAFHERKALAHNEKMNARKRDTEFFNESVPNYNQSLKQSIIEFETELNEQDNLFNETSRQKLDDLKKHFYNDILNKI